MLPLLQLDGPPQTLEGTPRLAERGRSPFKPQTALLRLMTAVVRTTSGEARDLMAEVGLESL
jgi:hypothetical protein